MPNRAVLGSLRNLHARCQATVVRRDGSASGAGDRLQFASPLADAHLLRAQRRARSAGCTADVSKEGACVNKILYSRVVLRVAALMVTVAALGAPRKWR